MAVYGIISESSRHNAKVAAEKMGLVQVLVDILSIKKTKELDHIVLLAVKCLWVIISKPINTNNITSNMEDEEDNDDNEEEEEEREKKVENENTVVEEKEKEEETKESDD